MSTPRELLIEQLKENSTFWSYDLSAEHGVISDELLMEQTLLHGDVDQLLLLFSIFSKEQIRTFWERKLVPHEKYRRINHYLGVFFFQVTDISSFLNQRIIAYPRMERLRLLATKD